jgi:hypothetical protein
MEKVQIYFSDVSSAPLPKILCYEIFIKSVFEGKQKHVDTEIYYIFVVYLNTMLIFQNRQRRIIG